jgi:hypothetical protein
LITHRREHLTDELNRQLISIIVEHLLQSNTSIDEWLIMFKSIIYQEVTKKNKKAWHDVEKKFLNLYNSRKRFLGQTQLKVRSLGLVQICLHYNQQRKSGKT